MITPILYTTFSFLLALTPYAYTFPVYPDYNIPEEYFHTRFHEEWFDSPRNWFQAWKKLIEWLNEHQELIYEFDNYYNCFFDNGCDVIDPNMTQEELDLLYKSVINNEALIDDFWNLLYTFLEDTESIMADYDYISYKNFENDSDASRLGWEILTYSRLLAFTRAMRLYIHLSDMWEKTELIDRYLAVISWLSYNIDADTISYLVIISLHNRIYDYLESEIHNISPWQKNLLSRIIQKHTISDDMIYNASRFWYFYGSMLYKGEIQDNLSSISRLFYNHDETLNILRQLEYNRSERIYEKLEYRWINIIKRLQMIEAWFMRDDYYPYDNNVALNGRNLIWRILLNSIVTDFERLFQQEEEIIQRRLEIINLLSQ